MGIDKMTPLLVAVCILAISSASGENDSESQVPERKFETDTSGNCPDKWLDASFVEMGCLFFNNTLEVSWEEANGICQMNSNSTLVDIQSDMQMGFLQMELEVIATT